MSKRKSVCLLAWALALSALAACQPAAETTITEVEAVSAGEAASPTEPVITPADGTDNFVSDAAT